ncbi:hypothetical protein EVAR_86694_1 [Eumeta japonica]|uniref:CHK kinase-like domain-containing protein n=1 Tax=Eumeta variegata TaxID=151549 RepID=A0A4C1XWA5_EUMVA|nr:hypothetical protein EVAR_86694_1 [Eumeta japonica]
MVNAEKILNELLQTVIEDEGLENPEITIKPFSTEGANYSSTLHLITINSQGREDLELFAKVGSVGEQMRAAVDADRFYETERFFYLELRKIYERLQNRIPEEERLVFPKFYACRDTYLEDTMIIENLAAKGYTCYDRFKPVTWEYAAAAVGELAKLHALSYAFAEDDPELFHKVATDRPMRFPGPEDHMKTIWEKSTSDGVNMVPDAFKARLTKFFESHAEPETFGKYYISPRRPVLVHGDYRASNLMHKYKNGNVESLIPVDYQTLHCGSPISDLLYFIFNGTDAEFREHHYGRLIDHYYATFAGYLLKLNLDPEELYPREHFDEDYKRYLPYGLLLAVFLLPLVLVDVADVPSMGDLTDMESFIFKANDLYADRFNGIVQDFVDWGVI